MTRRSSTLWRCAVLACVLIVGDRGAASAQAPRLDVGLHVAGVRAVGRDAIVVSPGIGVTIDVNLAERFGLEARYSWFPRREITTESQGGRMWHAAVGVRGRLLQSRRFAVDGLLLPGLLRFSKTATGFTTLTIPGPHGPETVVGQSTGPARRFVLGLGGGVEFRPARRWSARFEYLYQLTATRGAEYRFPPSPAGGTLSLVTPAAIQARWQVSAAVGYRAGSLQQDAPVTSARRWAVGPQLGYGLSESVIGEATHRTDAALGGFASYRFLKFVHADAAVSLAIDRALVTSPFEGGRVAVGLAGVRVGVETGRYGLFIKARAGAVSHSRTIRATDPAVGARVYGRATYPALDLGGVVQVRMTSRLFVRIEAGNLLTFIRDERLFSNGELLQSIQTTLGAGWRF